MHGGAIRFDSQAGNGSTFSFYIKTGQSSNVPQRVELKSPVMRHHKRDQTLLLPHITSTGAVNPIRSAEATETNKRKTHTDTMHVLIVEKTI